MAASPAEILAPGMLAWTSAEEKWQLTSRRAPVSAASERPVPGNPGHSATAKKLPFSSWLAFYRRAYRRTSGGLANFPLTVCLRVAMLDRSVDVSALWFICWSWKFKGSWKVLGMQMLHACVRVGWKFLVPFSWSPLFFHFFFLSNTRSKIILIPTSIKRKHEIWYFFLKKFRYLTSL